MFKSRRPREHPDGSARAAEPPRDAALDLALPNPYGGKPWLSMTLALSRSPCSHGETLRLRAHVDSCLRMGSQRGPALPDAGGDGSSLAGFGRRLAASAVRHAIARVPEHRLAPLTQRRRRGWLDVQVSTAPLDNGADAMVPERLRGVVGAGLPRTTTGRPRIGVWSGPAGGPRGGRAGLLWLQLDEQDFPGAEQGRVDDAGVSVNASMCRVVEPDAGGG